MTRSFYLGDIPKEDIKAKYEGGVLRLSVPKSDMKQIENKGINFRRCLCCTMCQRRRLSMFRKK